MTRFIIKSKAHGDRIVKIDEADAYLLRSSVWHLHPGSPVGTLYVARWLDRELVTLHRYLLGAKFDDRVNFANGDTLDVRRSNLSITRVNAKTRAAA